MSAWHWRTLWLSTLHNDHLRLSCVRRSDRGCYLLTSNACQYCLLLTCFSQTALLHTPQRTRTAVVFVLVLCCSIFCYGCMFASVVFLSVVQYYAKRLARRTSPKWPILCQVGQNLNSINQSVGHTPQSPFQRWFYR